MVNLFGDWFSDLVVISFVLVCCIIFYYFIAKQGKTRNQSILVSALIVFLITAFSFLGSLFFDYSFYTPHEGFVIFGVIMIIALIAVIVTVRRLYPDAIKLN